MDEESLGREEEESSDFESESSSVESSAVLWNNLAMFRTSHDVQIQSVDEMKTHMYSMVKEDTENDGNVDPGFLFRILVSFGHNNKSHHYKTFVFDDVQAEVMEEVFVAITEDDLKGLCFVSTKSPLLSSRSAIATSKWHWVSAGFSDHRCDRLRP
eukprot:scaffold98_cov172-Amphora_coffeaeformis.AAC.4